MAKLSAAARKKLPASAFAIPSKRAYPIEDKAHARAALALRNKPAGQGHQAEIAAKAKAVLQRGK